MEWYIFIQVDAVELFNFLYNGFDLSKIMGPIISVGIGIELNSMHATAIDISKPSEGIIQQQSEDTVFKPKAFILLETIPNDCSQKSITKTRELLEFYIDLGSLKNFRADPEYSVRLMKTIQDFNQKAVHDVHDNKELNIALIQKAADLFNEINS